MKFLVDMNLSPEWVPFLNEAGFGAIHWADIGPSDAPDAQLMQWAVENGHVLLTCDLDFGAILAATNAALPSVIQIRSDLLAPHAIGRAVIAAIEQACSELLAGAILSVELDRARLRILPIRE